jgi:uncharacterized membrane protein
MTSLPASSPAVGWYRRPELWSAALATVGIAIAGYLTIVHFRESLLVCSGISDCETVQTSQYAEILGIPVALLGLLCFIALFGLAVVRIIQPERADIITMIMFVMVVGSIGFYIYLTYLELFVIDAICQWCVASSLLMAGMLVTESILLRRVLSIPGE